MSSNNALTLVEIHLDFLVGCGVTTWLGEVEGSNLKSPYLFGEGTAVPNFSNARTKMTQASCGKSG